jgi:hypothetical protein
MQSFLFGGTFSRAALFVTLIGALVRMVARP